MFCSFCCQINDNVTRQTAGHSWWNVFTWMWILMFLLWSRNDDISPSFMCSQCLSVAVPPLAALGQTFRQRRCVFYMCSQCLSITVPPLAALGHCASTSGARPDIQTEALCFLHVFTMFVRRCASTSGARPDVQTEALCFLPFYAFVRLSVCLFVCLSDTKLVNMIFWKTNKLVFMPSGSIMGQGHETMNFESPCSLACEPLTV